MSLCCVPDEDFRTEKKLSKKIDAQIKKDDKKDKKILKLLFLGPGEAGKTTFLKQLRIGYDNGFDKNEVLQFKKRIPNILLENMFMLIDSLDQFGLKLTDNSKPFLAEIQPLRDIENPIIKPKHLGAMNKLWQDPGIVTLWDDHRNKLQIMESINYFFKNINKLIAPNYMPSNEDILKLRIRSTGVSEHKFVIQDRDFLVVDVGGQRNERRKWIHQFQNVSAVIYITSLSDFDLTLYEDDNVNRFDESLDLFKTILDMQWFKNRAILLLLNKVDLLKQKVESGAFAKVFPDCKNNRDFDSASKFLKSKYEKVFAKANSELSLADRGKRSMYSYFSCATDTQSAKFVLNAVIHSILERELSSIW